MEDKLICKCCGEEARFCGVGEKACGDKNCDHVHCDNCGMHYSIERSDFRDETSLKVRMLIMKNIFNGEA